MIDSWCVSSTRPVAVDDHRIAKRLWRSGVRAKAARLSRSSDATSFLEMISMRFISTYLAPFVCAVAVAACAGSPRARPEAVGAPASVTRAPAMPDRDYLVYVVAESADDIALLRFGPNGGTVDH